jgi:hypothetical protein
MEKTVSQNVQTVEQSQENIEAGRLRANAGQFWGAANLTKNFRDTLSL